MLLFGTLARAREQPATMENVVRTHDHHLTRNTMKNCKMDGRQFGPNGCFIEEGSASSEDTLHLLNWAQSDPRNVHHKYSAEP